MAGSYDTFLSFFGFVNPTAASANFMGLPNYAASMAFELFTEERTFIPDQLMVRFLFRNGIDGDQNLAAFPLFGNSELDMPYSQFVEELGAHSIRGLND
ncbi:uncharacterized protein HMPREF1541_01454 [Cyphellophora europaea CBS 101466]|uniref:Uncharacterized protein n=1 Tax=Cyphellophora europaea (strain CBS 101466) TaxID=1220924 RepID=W2SEZ5_CYPE1|nr:uncharacterized protein HMPREF1541_01454 [Cyphellophora europaea CBS 101466]ETN47262.1 hypothetical protein HMPREF1541_01454 [Cyphellophora europaea CBS 101466]